MKRFLTLVLVLMLSCLFVTALNAEESVIAPSVTENATPEANAPTGEENAPTDEPADLPTEVPTDEAPSWGTTVTTTEFFDTVVMPILISIGTLLVSFPVVGVPFLKMWGKVRTYAAALKLKTEENENLNKLLKTTDVAEFKTALSALLTEDLKTAIQNVKIDEAAIAEMNGQIATINAKMENFMKAAENAWSASPAAVSLLTSAESTAIKSMAAKITSYENYIRAEKGAEAEGIIHSIEGV